MKSITISIIAFLFLLPAVSFAGGGYDDYTIPSDIQNTPSAYTATSSPVGMTGTNEPASRQLAAAGSAGTLPLTTGTKTILWVLGIIVAALVGWGSYHSWKQNQIMR